MSKTDKVRGKGWMAFKEDAPERVVSVIENGPMPLKEYPCNLTWNDKQRGMMRYKGADGRRHGTAKSGYAAVVYFDPAFTQREHTVIDVPDKVLERHSDENVREAFEQL